MILQDRQDATAALAPILMGGLGAVFAGRASAARNPLRKLLASGKARHRRLPVLDDLSILDLARTDDQLKDLYAQYHLADNAATAVAHVDDLNPDVLGRANRIHPQLVKINRTHPSRDFTQLPTLIHELIHSTSHAHYPGNTGEYGRRLFPLIDPSIMSGYRDQILRDTNLLPEWKSRGLEHEELVAHLISGMFRTAGRGLVPPAHDLREAVWAGNEGAFKRIVGNTTGILGNPGKRVKLGQHFIDLLSGAQRDDLFDRKMTNILFREGY